MIEYYTIERTTDATAELFTSAVAANYAKLEDNTATADADLITTLIKAARMKAENYTNRAFINQTWTINIDGTPDYIDLPKGETSSVTTVKIVAEDGTKTTESATTTYHTQTGESGRIWLLRNSGSWTSTTRDYGQMEIIYVAGYGAASITVPDDIIQAVKQIFAVMYEKRSNDVEIPESAYDLLSPYKIYRLL